MSCISEMIIVLDLKDCLHQPPQHLFSNFALEKRLAWDIRKFKHLLCLWKDFLCWKMIDVKTYTYLKYFHRHVVCVSVCVLCLCVCVCVCVLESVCVLLYSTLFSPSVSQSVRQFYSTLLFVFVCLCVCVRVSTWKYISTTLIDSSISCDGVYARMWWLLKWWKSLTVLLHRNGAIYLEICKILVVLLLKK